jgi:hypothetical protein
MEHAPSRRGAKEEAGRRNCPSTFGGEDERHQQKEEKGKLELLLTFSLRLSDFCLLRWSPPSSLHTAFDDFPFYPFVLLPPFPAHTSYTTGIHDEGSKKQAEFCWVISLFVMLLRARYDTTSFLLVFVARGPALLLQRRLL